MTGLVYFPKSIFGLEFKDLLVYLVIKAYILFYKQSISITQISSLVCVKRNNVIKSLERLSRLDYINIIPKGQRNFYSFSKPECSCIPLSFLLSTKVSSECKAYIINILPFLKIDKLNNSGYFLGSTMELCKLLHLSRNSLLKYEELFVEQGFMQKDKDIRKVFLNRIFTKKDNPGFINNKIQLK